MILDDFQFTRYLRATQLTTVQVSSTIETTFGRIVNKDFKYDMFRIISSHMRVLRFWKKIIGIEIRLSLNKKKKIVKTCDFISEEKKKTFYLHDNRSLYSIHSTILFQVLSGMYTIR